VKVAEHTRVTQHLQQQQQQQKQQKGFAGVTAVVMRAQTTTVAVYSADCGYLAGNRTA
jgi:hypothetical protein